MKNIFNNKWVSIFALLLLLANAVTLGLLWTRQAPHPPPPPGSPENGRVADFLIRELGLNKEQEAKYENLIQQHRQHLRPMMDSLQMAKEAFFKLLQEDNDTQKIESANNAIAKQDLQINTLNFNHFKKLRAICTPEQQMKLDKLLQKVLLRMGSQNRNNGPKDSNMPPPPEKERFREMPPPKP